MRYVEIILQFLTVLLRTIFPRKEVLPPPLPHGPGLPLPPDAGDGGDAGRHRRDPDAPAPPTDWPALAGYTLMAAGGAGWVARYWWG